MNINLILTTKKNKLNPMAEEQDPADVDSSPSEVSPTKHVAETRDFAVWKNSRSIAVESPAGGEGGVCENQKCRPPATSYLIGTSAEPVTETSAQKRKGNKMCSCSNRA